MREQHLLGIAFPAVEEHACTWLRDHMASMPEWSESYKADFGMPAGWVGENRIPPRPFRFTSYMALSAARSNDS